MPTCGGAVGRRGRLAELAQRLRRQLASGAVGVAIDLSEMPALSRAQTHRAFLTAAQAGSVVLVRGRFPAAAQRAGGRPDTAGATALACCAVSSSRAGAGRGDSAAL
jgi:hypothetical protein